MSALPSFNYTTVYFFIMSFFAAVFILSLTDTLNVKNPIILALTSLINVFLGILAWIGDWKFEQEFKKSKTAHYTKKEDIDNRDRNKFYNLVGVTSCTFIIAVIGLLFQI